MDFSAMGNSLGNAMGAELPRILGAIVILIIGWILAVVVRGGVRRLLALLRLNRLIAETTEQKLDLESGLSAGAFWLIILVTLIGAGLAWALFRNGTATQEQPAGALVRAARRNLYTDAFNEAVFERPGIYLTRALVYLDNKGIDGLVNGIAAGVGGSSGRLRRLQTGFVRSYALSMLTGAVLVVGAFLAIQLGWLA